MNRIPGRRKTAAIIAGVAAATLLMTGLAPAANADLDTNMDGGEAVSVVEELAPTVDLVPADEVTQAGDTLIVDGGDVEISADAAQGTDLELPGGLEINIAPIADRGHGEGEIVDDQAVTPVGEDQSVVTQATEEGARMIGVLETPEADMAVDYALDLPAGVTLIPNEDGGYHIGMTREAENQPVEGAIVTEVVAVGEIEAPWAVDANGVPVDTHYVYNETSETLTQVVTPSSETAFPVVADPAVSVTKLCLPFTNICRVVAANVDFNWKETKKIADLSGGSLKDFATLACGVVAVIGTPVLGLICEGFVLGGSALAKGYVKLKRCMAFSAILGPPVVVTPRWHTGASCGA